ncbi:hypothetical protein MMC13_001961 [Lambiella insularis]|nr:hypothetical protein [Lambiella insularis]
MKLLSVFFCALVSITTVSASRDTLSCWGSTSPSKSYSAAQTFTCVVDKACDCVGGHVACWPPNRECAQLCECVEEIANPPPYASPPRSGSDVSNKSNFVKHYSKKWWAAAKKVFKKAHHRRMIMEQQEYAVQLYRRALRAQEMLGF